MSNIGNIGDNDDDTIALPPRKEYKATKPNLSPESDSPKMPKPEEIKAAGCDFNSSNL